MEKDTPIEALKNFLASEPKFPHPLPGEVSRMKIQARGEVLNRKGEVQWPGPQAVLRFLNKYGGGFELVVIIKKADPV